MQSSLCLGSRTWPRALTATLAWLILAVPAAAQIRVACLGDSITFGARIADREHSSYPNWLDDFLGDSHEVRNFGVGGATLLYEADRPYAKTTAFRDARAWRPHIAFVILGTNDSCENDRRHNWRHYKSLAADAKKMVAALHLSRPDMRIVLCSPTPMFADKRGLKAERKSDLETRGKRLAACAFTMQHVAATTDHVEYLELRNTLTADHVSDGVHPTAFGAERIARRVAEAIRSPRTKTAAHRTQLHAELGERNITPKAELFHDFDGISFDLADSGANCRVIFPHGTARGTPWVLRARFFGHQPALDIALLERGFHLVYCDVSNLYGAEAAMSRYYELHSLLEDARFHPKAVLEGMSRGGLQIVNWAIRYPQRVAAIYGDNPVVDIRSWPGGKNGKRSDADWQRCLQAYELTEETADKWQLPTADDFNLLKIEDVPMLLVLGSDDKVVPPKENGEVLAQRYAQAGGEVQVWRKPGNGHHPHGLHPVAPLLRAILEATGFGVDIATIASPSVEYRSGAGWNGDSWRTQVAKMRALAEENQDTPLVFLGDSITQGLTGARDRLARKGGARAIDQVFGDRGAISLGLSGDRTEHILYRLQHGALRELRPKVIVLQIGVNNVVTGKHTAKEISDGIKAIVEQLRRSHRARVLVCGPLPAGSPNSTTRATINAIHLQLESIGQQHPLRPTPGHATYLDLRPLFLNEDGTCNKETMRSDRIHITEKGQHAWMKAIAPAIDRILEGR